MTIDVGALSKAGSEGALLGALAAQTGYWPVFSFLNSLNNMVDLASVGIIGQKGASLSLRPPTRARRAPHPVSRFAFAPF